jgi:hypothetical protein
VLEQVRRGLVGEAIGHPSSLPRRLRLTPTITLS